MSGSTSAAASRVRLFHRLHLAAHVVRRAADRSMLAGAGLTMVQAGVLSVLAESGPTSQRDIARRLGVNEPSVTEMVRRLLAAGCVSKEVDPGDGRARRIALTDRGRAVLADGRPAFAVVNRAFADVLTTAEVEVLADLLGRLHDRFAARTEPPDHDSGATDTEDEDEDEDEEDGAP